MSDRASALGADLKPGEFGNLANGVGVTLGETFFGFIAEIAAFAGSQESVSKLVWKSEARIEGSLAFPIAKGRWLAAGSGAFRAALENGLDGSEASFIDLTQGRTGLTVGGPKAEWVLSKLFAVDFRQSAFPERTGLATMHHDTFAQIYRTGADGFVILVYRSFARSFWHALRRAAEETGYEVG